MIERASNPGQRRVLRGGDAIRGDLFEAKYFWLMGILK